MPIASSVWDTYSRAQIKLAWMNEIEWLRNEYEMKQENVANTRDTSPVEAYW